MAESEFELPQWPVVVARLHQACGTEVFPAQLVDWLCRAASLEIDAPLTAAILYNQHQAPPRILYGECIHPTRQQAFDRYYSGLYLLDPVYRSCTENAATGCYNIEQLSPDHFLQSEYYKQYYQEEGLTDAVDYIIHISENSAVNITVGRMQGGGSFSKREGELLRALEPLVSQWVLQHWGDELQQQQMPNPDKAQFHQQLQAGYDHFGESVLTPRERDVVHLMLRGHSQKSAAEVLAISPGTIKEYRKHIYAKLDISTHAELFALFFDALKSYDGGKQDPLADYLS